MKLHQLLLSLCLLGISFTGIADMDRPPQASETSNAEKRQFVQYILQDEGTLDHIDIINTPTGRRIYSIFERQALTDSDLEDICIFIQNPFLKDLLFRLLHKEDELKKAGYVTYIHGQSRRYYWPEKLYTILWSIRNKQDISNFLFAHVHDMRLSARVKNLLKPINYSYIGKKNLCMNGRLFSGPSAAQNSTYYIEGNSNFVPVELTAKDACDYLEYGHIYQQFSAEIQAIDGAYKTLCKYGNALLVAVPESKKEQYISQHPAGCDEFFLPMTSQAGLNPASGIKVFPLITGNREALATLKNRENSLLIAIKTAIEKPRPRL